MKRIIRLTESDLTRIVKRVLKENEEEYLDLDSVSGGKNTIEFDLRRERSKEKKVRKLVSDDPNYEKMVPITHRVQPFEDILYGYNRLNEKVVRARQSAKFGKSIGLDDLVINYNCDTETIIYGHVGQPISKQEKSDKDWLGSWCTKITWTTRVGKKKGLFRK